MKKNILTAISIAIMTIILFLAVSTTSTERSIAASIIEDSISETYIPSETIIFEKLSGEVLIAEVIENEVEVKVEVETTTKPQKPVSTTTPSKKEETTTKKEELTTKPVETTTVIEKVETTVETTTEKIDNDIWAQRKAQYPVATEIWLYMKSLGWNDAVCAGIMGNIMAEVGGHTLNIRPYLYDSSGQYYGMCQWYIGYYPQIKGASLQTQCNYLRDTIKKELNTFGYKYSSSMNYANFLALTSPSEAAVVFAKCYERCASFSYNSRQTNAQKAYSYFVG